MATYGAIVMLDMVPAEHWGKPYVVILLFAVILGNHHKTTLGEKICHTLQ